VVWHNAELKKEPTPKKRSTHPPKLQGNQKQEQNNKPPNTPTNPTANAQPQT